MGCDVDTSIRVILNNYTNGPERPFTYERYVFSCLMFWHDGNREIRLTDRGCYFYYNTHHGDDAHTDVEG
ncbi:hypothetical protein XELAEV_18000719mg [Xenopus laevis]|uniref:Uncharacterized protein n=1 Tax=Xenopus laevis TaxID=8355 RepID=A0A974BP48_XENLA|nr:hypothetical protein XELAEV_18000719mg [Xenopus laevis]